MYPLIEQNKDTLIFAGFVIAILYIFKIIPETIAFFGKNTSLVYCGAIALSAALFYTSYMNEPQQRMQRPRRPTRGEIMRATGEDQMRRNRNNKPEIAKRYDELFENKKKTKVLNSDKS